MLDTIVSGFLIGVLLTNPVSDSEPVSYPDYVRFGITSKFNIDLDQKSIGVEWGGGSKPREVKVDLKFTPLNPSLLKITGGSVPIMSYNVSLSTNCHTETIDIVRLRTYTQNEFLIEDSTNGGPFSQWQNLGFKLEQQLIEVMCPIKKTKRKLRTPTLL